MRLTSRNISTYDHNMTTKLEAERRVLETFERLKSSGVKITIALLIREAKSSSWKITNMIEEGLLAIK